MKKIVLSLALLGGAIMGANAQLAFQYEGEPVVNNASITYDGYVSENYGYDDYMEYKLEPGIFLVSSVDGNVEIHMTSNIPIQICAGGNCVLGDDVTKPGANEEPIELKAGVPLDLKIDYVEEGTGASDEDIEFPAINFTVTAQYVGDASSRIAIDVKMGGFSTAVESIAVSHNGVRVNGRTLHYDVNGASDLAIYSLSGKTVLNRSVSGNGSINLGNLPSGIYLYRVNGKAGKFIIK